MLQLATVVDVVVVAVVFPRLVCDGESDEAPENVGNLVQTTVKSR